VTLNNATSRASALESDRNERSMQSPIRAAAHPGTAVADR
jgi:hypothetical protein